MGVLENRVDTDIDFEEECPISPVVQAILSLLAQSLEAHCDLSQVEILVVEQDEQVLRPVQLDANGHCPLPLVPLSKSHLPLALDHWEALRAGEWISILGPPGHISVVGRNCARGAPGSILIIPLMDHTGLQSLVCIKAKNYDQLLSREGRKRLDELCRNASLSLANVRATEELQSKNAEQHETISQLNKSLETLSDENRRRECFNQIRFYRFTNFLHELRNTLVALCGYTKLMAGGYAGHMNATQREFLGIMLDHANKLVAATNNWQQVAEVDQLSLETLDITEVGEKVVEGLRPTAARKSVALVETVGERPIVTTGDHKKLEAVLNKLLSNAIRSTSPGGQIDFEIMREDGQITLRVSDNREAIIGELVGELASLSGPSDKICSTEHRHLSFIQETVWLHGGTISKTNGLGQGCTVVLTLPVIRVG